MPLEPTEDQLDRIAEFIAGRLGMGQGLAMHYGREHEARLIWALIRDMVLESAAEEIDSWAPSYDDHAESVRIILRDSVKPLTK